MDNTFQDLMWIYWAIKSYRRRKEEVFREDREEEDGGFELYKSILFKYFNDNGFHFFSSDILMITILILSSGELKAISQNRVWDKKRFCSKKNAGLKKYIFPQKQVLKHKNIASPRVLTWEIYLQFLLF